MSPKDLLKIVLFPVYSAFSSKVGFTCFLPTSNGWKAYTRGAKFRVRKPTLGMLEYFRHFVPAPGGVVFDVGGELGRETEQLAQIVGNSGHVFTFECFPNHIARLKSLAAEYGNITVVERACWNKSTEIEFYEGNTPGSGSAVEDVRGQRGQTLAKGSSFTVQADTLDSLWVELTDSSTIDFLKMDIEGAEYEALEGATELLRNTNKVVIAAYHQRDGVATAKKVDEYLKAAGFTTRTDENLHVYGSRN